MPWLVGDNNAWLLAVGAGAMGNRPGTDPDSTAETAIWSAASDALAGPQDPA